MLFFIKHDQIFCRFIKKYSNSFSLILLSRSYVTTSNPYKSCLRGSVSDLRYADVCLICSRHEDCAVRAFQEKNKRWCCTYINTFRSRVSLRSGQTLREKTLQTYESWVYFTQPKEILFVVFQKKVKPYFKNVLQFFLKKKLKSVIEQLRFLVNFRINWRWLKITHLILCGVFSVVVLVDIGHCTCLPG